MTSLLELDDVHVHYGKVEALKGVSCTVAEGEVVTLIGANGAGKTTTLKTISGVVPMSSGRIAFDGRDISGMAPHRRVELGICQAPEGRGIFPGMTVTENLEMGAYARRGGRKGYASDLDRVLALFPRLRERITQAGGTLSGGEQQMLAIGRALMASPKLLLLDEPSLGLAPRIIGQIGEVIAEINRQGTSVLLVEQNATMALGVADLAYVLDVGEVSLSGDARELARTDEVQRLYLGHDTEEAVDRPRVASGKTLTRWTA